MLDEDQHSSHPGRRSTLRMYETEAKRRKMEDQPTRKSYKGMTSAELAVLAAQGVTRSPFTDEILETLIPDKKWTKDLPIYEGMADPMDHIILFQQKLGVKAHDDAFQCQAFPSSLGGGCADLV